MKKIICMILTITMLLALSITAFAAENHTGVKVQANSENNISGEIVLTEQQYVEYLASLSEDDLQKIAEKESTSAQYAGNAATRATGTLIQVPGTFTMYQQETDNYCIPATVKSILTYITGSSPTQSEIAGTTGTDPSKIPAYLNDRQDEIYYVYVKKSDFTQNGMCSKLYSTIVTNKMPASMGISGTKATNWYYATSGHSLVVHGIYDDYSYIRIADPLGDRVAGCPYFYSKSASECYNVCTRLVW